MALISAKTWARRWAKAGSSFVVIWSRGARQGDVEGLADRGRRRRQHHDPVGEVHRLVDVVGDEQHRDPVRRPHVQQQVLELGAGLGVDRRERLVHQQDLGLVRQRPRDRGSLLHAAGELPRELANVVAEPDRRQRLGGHAHALGLLDALRLERHGHVVEQVEPRQQRPAVVLEHQRHRPRRLRHPLAEQAHLALRRRHQPGETAQHRGFAGAGRPDDAHELARLNRQRHVVDGGERIRPARAVRHAEPVDDQQRLGHGPSPAVSKPREPRYQRMMRPSTATNAKLSTTPTTPITMIPATVPAESKPRCASSTR